MACYLTIDEICAENKMLKEKIIGLEKDLEHSKEINTTLKEIIDSRNEDDAVKILEYFHSCSSIRKTAWKFGMDMEELYEVIPEWDGCRDGLQSADDYDECRLEVIGRQQWDEEQETEQEEEEIKEKRRNPEPDELNNIISDYKDSNLSLYELADRYDLWINNLFRILKENKLIEKETDAKGYASFYQEHYGIWSEWDGKSDFGLLE
jgi:hypothetical protein